MERAKEERRMARALFTKCVKKLEDALSTQNPSSIGAAYSNLQGKREKLMEIDNRIFSMWLDLSDKNEEEYLKDIDNTEEYTEKWYELTQKYKEAKTEDASAITIRKYKSASNSSSISSSDKANRLLKLPKLELPKFDGDIRNWIHFWGIFEKIHTDPGMNDDIKFQYLVQCMEPGSSAQKMMDSYPPTAANYTKAIVQLKERFGRDELLIEIYVRELLTLVLQQNNSGSSTPIGTLYDKLKTQLNALESLGVTSDRYAAMLRPLVESALPIDLLRVWERKNKEQKDPSNLLANLLDFIKLEVESEERIMISRNVRAIQEPSASCFNTAVKTLSASEKRNCLFCEKATQHVSSECSKAMKMSLQERRDCVKNKKACYICLTPGHMASRCRCPAKCMICGKRHVTLMCGNATINNAPLAGNASPNVDEQNSQVLLYQSSVPTIVLLPTLILKVVHKDKNVIVRALLDSGAQKSFIKASVAKELNLKPFGEAQIIHNLFGGVVTKREVHKTYLVTLKSLERKFETNIEVLDQITICQNLPKAERDIIKALKEKGIQVSDSYADISEISLLIGADYLGSLMTGSMVTLKNNLIAIETHFGWSVQGPTKCIDNSSININQATFDVEDLWKLETVGIKDDAETHKVAESEMSNFFESTIKTNEDGRYEVKLPFKDLINLPSNYDIALKRLKSNTARLARLSILKDYDQQFKEWKESDIIEVVQEEDRTKGHYLPHHAVIKEASLTTKIRPVFDASACQTKDGLSLNECLEKGQNMIELIPSLFIKFRKGAIGVVSDIKKAFLQISLYPEDRDCLKFLWWRDIDENPKQVITYRHKRVVFGLITSPYLLMATIYYHLNKYDSETAYIMKESFYCDNCVTSVDDEEKLEKFAREATDIMSEGKFELRCWVSSGPNLLDKSVTETSVLGLRWNTRSDELFCKVPDIKNRELTKRTLLSLAQSIFDPIGFTSPYTLIPKILVQKCWKRDIDWDTKLPDDLHKETKDWLQNIEVIGECRIPRKISHADLKLCQCTLHTFSDASAMAFSACVFLRSEYDGKVTVQLILAKSRVTPTKPITIPRLELTAAVLASRLARETKRALDLPLQSEYYWTDSAIVLAWIQKESNSNQVFVDNRIREIKRNCQSQDWRHLPGALNPADLPSRGCNARTLLKSKWWNGPDWLKRPSSEWPSNEPDIHIEEVKEEDKKTCLVVHTDDGKFSDRLDYFSKYTKTIRTMAWCIRFYRNCRKKVHQSALIKGEITAEAYEEAERIVFKIIQREELSNVEALKKSMNLDIYEDEDKLLRVRTRLTIENDKKDFIAPFILPGSNSLVQKLVSQTHVKYCHAGVLILLNKLREYVYIIGARRLAKTIVRKCSVCRRYSAKQCSTPPAPLPSDRTKCGAVFDVTGIDYAGPLCLRNKEKCWIALFTCATYRAIHLELCRGLSTDEFMLALRRFIARRGRPNTIYTDNGTNFKGAERLLRNIDWRKIETDISVNKIKWRFSPPSSPWWGGFWERMVKSVKEMLRRMLGKASLDAVSLQTTLCEVESVLNSRPLTYTDTDELVAITPAHFLQDYKSYSTPDLDQVDLNTRLRYVLKIRDDFKIRFRNEYLSLLVQKIGGKTLDVQPGDVVLLECENTKRLNWPLALVLEVFPGTDGHHRVARVKTAKGELVRPLRRLYPLEALKSK